jgi:hypothetical protein
LDTWYTDSASAAKRTTTCLNFLDCPTTLGSEFAAEFPGIKTPFDFLKNLQGLLRGVYECLNSDILHVSKGPFEDLQKAILFMGERDADGGESNSDGILQILKRDWNNTKDEEKVEKAGLATDLETLSRLADQRLKICRSKILTLNGKAKRAQLTKEDPRSSCFSHHLHSKISRFLVAVVSSTRTCVLKISFYLLTNLQLSAGSSCSPGCSPTSPVARARLVLTTIQRPLGVPHHMP